MTVEILDYTSGHEQVLGTVSLVAGHLMPEGDIPQSFMDDWEEGLRYNGKIVYMDQGETFLRALVQTYSGSYVRARIKS